MAVVLTIAGSDACGGAGVQADLKTFAAHVVYGASALTAITAQNTTGVTAVQALAPDLVAAQIDAVMRETGADAVKTGMLASREIVDVVADAAQRHQWTRLVVDPVLVATSGARLLDDDAVKTVRRRLLSLAAVVTPNLPEAEVLAGVAIQSEDDAREAARRIHALGPAAVIITDGHGASAETVNDLLLDVDGFRVFHGPRVPGGSIHGTGCTFSAALAAQLAVEQPLDAAVRAAQAYVVGAIRHGRDGIASRLLNHAWRNSGSEPG
jgi:hydroxymethylpyrimidine/phosphomethylpyrimidine kinase